MIDLTDPEAVIAEVVEDEFDEGDGEEAIPPDELIQAIDALQDVRWLLFTLLSPSVKEVLPRKVWKEALKVEARVGKILSNWETLMEEKE